MPGMKYKRGNLGKAFDSQDDRPVFDSSIGYLVLLDNLSKYANGYMISGEYESYFQCLDQIFTELYPIITRRGENLSKEFIQIRKKAHAAISQIRINSNGSIYNYVSDLKRYHMILNCLMHEKKLRLRTTDDLPGVMKGHG